MNLIDVTRQFPTEDHCLDFLEKQRWPDGVVRCAVCGCSQVSRITRKTPSKNKRTRIYQCLEKTCKQQFSATSGTIYDGSHLPLVKWFAAISLMVRRQEGPQRLADAAASRYPVVQDSLVSLPPHPQSHDRSQSHADEWHGRSR